MNVLKKVMPSWSIKDPVEASLHWRPAAQTDVRLTWARAAEIRRIVEARS